MFYKIKRIAFNIFFLFALLFSSSGFSSSCENSFSEQVIRQRETLNNQERTEDKPTGNKNLNRSNLNTVKVTFNINNKRIPKDIRKKIQDWIAMVKEHGLLTVRQSRGFRDHLIYSGKYKKQRSVSLNKQWRLIYTVNIKNQIILSEITPHTY